MKAVIRHRMSLQRRVRRFPTSLNAIGVARATSQSPFSTTLAVIRPEKKRFIRLRVTRQRRYATTSSLTTPTKANRHQEAATLILPAHPVDGKMTMKMNIAKKIFTA